MRKIYAALFLSMKQSAALEDAFHIFSASVIEGGNRLSIRSLADKTKTFAQPTAEYYMFTQVKFPPQMKIGKKDTWGCTMITIQFAVW